MQNDVIKSILVGVSRGGKVEEQRDVNTPENTFKKTADDEEATNEEEEEFFTPAEDEEWVDEHDETRRNEVDTDGWGLEIEENYDDTNSCTIAQDDMGVYSLDVEIGDAQGVVGNEVEDEEEILNYTESGEDMYEYYEVEDNDEDEAEEQGIEEVDEVFPVSRGEVNEIDDMYEYVDEEEDDEQAIGEELDEDSTREILQKNEESENEEEVEEVYEYVDEDTELRVENEVMLADEEKEGNDEDGDVSSRKITNENEEFIDTRMDDEVDIEDDESNHSVESFQDDAQAEESIFEEDQYEDLVDAASVDDLVVPEKSQAETDETWEEVSVDVQEEEAPFIAEASIENNEVPIGSNAGAVDFGTDDDSSANVDRMDLADREDEGETTTGGFGEIDALADDARVPDDDPSDAPDDDDEKPLAEQATVPVQEEESTKSPESEEGEGQLVTTKEVRKVLRGQLGYTAREVRHMKPAIATVVAQKRLRRPNEGMPIQWYQNGPPIEIVVTLENMLRLYLKPAIVTLIAGWAATQNGGFSIGKSASPSKQTKKKKLEKASNKQDKVETVPFSPPPDPPVETYGLSEHKPQKLGEKDRARALLTHDPRTERSIPPHASDVQLSTPEPTDDSILDKAITGFEKWIKKVLSAEIPQKNG